MAVTLIRLEMAMDRGHAPRKAHRKHRHEVAVTTEAVIEAVGEMEDGWTTQDVASGLNVPERSVRAAVGWLLGARLIRQVGIVWSNQARREIARYAICHPAGKVSLLNQIIQAWATTA